MIFLFTPKSPSDYKGILVLVLLLSKSMLVVIAFGSSKPQQ